MIELTAFENAKAEYMRKRKESGFCMRCSNPVGDSKSKWMCADCYKKFRAKENALKDEKRKKGICIEHGCTNPVDPNGKFTRCKECRDYRMFQWRYRKERKHEDS